MKILGQLWENIEPNGKYMCDIYGKFYGNHSWFITKITWLFEGISIVASCVCNVNQLIAREPHPPYW
jgi:hypothetical protein